MAGCFVLLPSYLFGIGYIIEVYGYGGAPGSQVLLMLVLLSTFAFAVARGLALFIERLSNR